jgi:hypothetical protein
LITENALTRYRAVRESLENGRRKGGLAGFFSGLFGRS